jgi:hypothetical protein
MLNFLKDCKITRVMNAVAAGTSEQKSSVLDMAGFDSVCFILALGTVTDASVVTATIYENTASSTSSPAPVTSGVVATLTASTDSNHLLVTEVIQPVKEFVFLDITRVTQNAAIDSVIAIQFNAKNKPVTQPATLVNSGFGVGV